MGSLQFGRRREVEETLMNRRSFLLGSAVSSAVWTSTAVELAQSQAAEPTSRSPRGSRIAVST